MGKGADPVPTLSLEEVLPASPAVGPLLWHYDNPLQLGYTQGTRNVCSLPSSSDSVCPSYWNSGMLLLKAS